MLLQADNIRIERKHVVNTLILEGLDIDSFILCKFDELANLMILRNQVIINVIEREVERINAHRLFALFHRDHIDLA